MRKYLLGVVAMVLSYSLFSFTEIKKEQKDTAQTEFYFLWNAGTSSWVQVEEEDELPNCPNDGTTNCSAVSSEISQGQPSGNVTIRTRQN